MKQTIKLMMVLFIAICSSAQGFAQNAERRMNREELAATQARHIAKELTLIEATTRRFIDTYCACQQEIWTLAPGQQRSADAAAKIENRFDRSQKILDIRRKYYAEYSKFLTPEQIDKVYRIEKRMMNRLVKKHKATKRPLPKKHE